MQSTQTLDLLKIKHPIIQGPFGGGLSTVEMVSTVSNLGGLGSFGVHYLEAEGILGVASEIREKTSCGATSQLSAERHRRWMTVTFFDGAGLRPLDQVSMSLLNVAGRELSFAVAVSFSGCCLSRSSSMSLSDDAAA